MDSPKLMIVHQQRAEIGLNIKRASVSISQPNADIRYSSPQPNVKYSIKQAKLLIDQSQAFDEANLKSPLTMTREAAQKAKQAVLKGISRRVREGNQLMDIAHTKRLMIPQMMKQRTGIQKKEFNIGYMPSSLHAVKIKYQPGALELDVNIGNFRIDVTPNDPIYRYQPGNLDIYLKQKNDLQFQAYTPIWNQGM